MLSVLFSTVTWLYNHTKGWKKTQQQSDVNYSENENNNKLTVQLLFLLNSENTAIHSYLYNKYQFNSYGFF